MGWCPTGGAEEGLGPLFPIPYSQFQIPRLGLRQPAGTEYFGKYENRELGIGNQDESGRDLPDMAHFARWPVGGGYVFAPTILGSGIGDRGSGGGKNRELKTKRAAWWRPGFRDGIETESSAAAFD